MAVDLARYVVSLEAQTAKYVQELDKANRKLDRFHKDQERALGAIKKAFFNLGVTLASALSVTAIVNFTKASVQMADQLGETSRAAGVSAETLQQLRFTFDQLGGIASGETDQGLQRFNRTLGLAINGSRQAQQQFRLLGVSFKDSFGRGRGTDATLESVLKALGEIENDAQRAAIAGRLFGNELGPKLAAALKGGSAALEQARTQVAGIISDESVAKAEALDDAFKRMAATLGGPLKEAAIGAAFEIGKIFGHVEDSKSDILNDRIEKTRQEIVRLESVLANQRSERDNVDWLERLFGMDEAEWNRRIESTQQQLLATKMNMAALEAAAAAPGGKPVAETLVEPLKDGLAEISTSFGRLPAELKKFDFASALNAAQFKEVSSVLVKMPDDLKKLSPEFNTAVASLVRYNDTLKEADERQKALAESLGAAFGDAFTDVLLGAERSFSDFLKRMAARMATSALFKGLGSLFPGGSFLSDFFGGFRANGGPLSPGKWYIAGEKGPEPVWGGGAGAFAMAAMPGGGSIAITNNIDARGADPSLAMRLPSILAENNQRLKAEIRHERNRGR